MRRNMENILYSTEYTGHLDIPLSVLTAKEQGEYDLSLLRKKKTSDFLNFSKHINNDLSQEAQIYSVIEAALMVEFGANILENKELIDIVTQTFTSDEFLRTQTLEFSQRNINHKKIDSSLIN